MISPTPPTTVPEHTVHLFGPVDPSWTPVLTPLADRLATLENYVRSEQSTGHPVLPPPPDVLRALTRPADEVKVVILGQDPYPTPGHSMGLAFSVQRDVRPLPRSLNNIFTELVNDLGIERPRDGDLTSWADQGVLLLNRCLTVRAGETGSHQGRGWEDVTAGVLGHLASRRQALVAILWGRQAQASAIHLPQIPTIVSPHPSPLSARRGFFGSKPFSRCNTMLAAQGAEPVNWRLPH